MDPERQRRSFPVGLIAEAEARVHIECGLTFDMRGGRKQAKLACGRPLDGRVRAHAGKDSQFEATLSGDADREAQAVTAKQNSCGTDVHATVRSGEAVEVLRAYTGSCAGSMDEQDELAVFGCEASTTLPGARTEPVTSYGRALAAEGRTARAGLEPKAAIRLRGLASGASALEFANAL